MHSPLSTGAWVASIPLRIGQTLAETGVEAERRVRGTIMSVGERALLSFLDSVAAGIVAERVIDQVLARAESAGVAQHVADRVLEDGVAEQIVERVLAGPELEHMLSVAFQSALPDEVVEQLLASEAIWILVDEVARSPAVTEAISHQGAGFVDMVASEARERSRRGDALVQRIANRLSLHRDRPAAIQGHGERASSVPLAGEPEV